MRRNRNAAGLDHFSVPARRRTRVAFAAVLAGFLLTATGTAISGGGGARAQVSANQQLANRLAAQLDRADTARERRQALLAVMRAINLGVYNSRGQAIVRGGERSHEDFFVHDFELEAIAKALARGQRFDLEALALALRAVGIAPGGKPLTAARLADILRDGVRQALRRPRRQRSLAPLLVRALGLRAPRPYDLRAVVAPERISFDPVAAFIVAADAALPPHPRGASARRRASAAGAGSSGSRRCPPIVRIEAFDFVGWQWPPPPGRIKRDPLHGLLLIFALEAVDVRPGFKQSHYGPVGHAPDAGRELDFEIAVRMTVAVPEALRCSPLTGKRLPRHGVVVGLPVRWLGEDTLINHGFGSTVDRETKGDGHASWHFVPRNEEQPGVGDERVVPGNLTARVASRRSVIADVLWPPGLLLPEVSVSWPFEVRYHEEGAPRNWTGTVQGTTTGAGGVTETWTANVTFTLTDETSTRFPPFGLRYRPTGTVEWSTSGSSGGCTHNGSGTMNIDPAEGTLDFNAEGTAYGGQGSLGQGDTYPIMVSCPGAGTVPIPGPHFGGTPGWFDTGPNSHSADPRVAMIHGSYPFNNPANGTTGSYNWSFQAQP